MLGVVGWRVTEDAATLLAFLEAKELQAFRCVMLMVIRIFTRGSPVEDLVSDQALGHLCKCQGLWWRALRRAAWHQI